MSAYLVAIRLRTTDPDVLETYRDLAASALLPEQEVLASYGPQDILEGPSHEGVVIFRFPDVETARRWYFSEEYQAAVKHRMNGGEFQLTLVEGWD